MIKQIEKISISIFLLIFTSCSSWTNTNSSYEDFNQDSENEERNKVNEDSFLITYELFGGINNSENPQYFFSSDRLIELKAPEKKGYNFLGWYLETSLQTKITEINPAARKSYNLYAGWELINYTIIYNLDGGINNSLNPQTYNIENNKIIFSNPVKEDCQFDGWFKDDAFTEPIYEIEANSIGDVSLFAKWSKKTESTVIFTEDTDIIHITIDRMEGNQIDLSATEGFVSYKWIVDDEIQNEKSHVLSKNFLPFLSGYHYITVLAKKFNGETISTTCTIRVTEECFGYNTHGTNTDEKISSRVMVSLRDDIGAISIKTSYSSNILNLTATRGYSSYKWIIDNEVLESTTNDISLNTLTEGYHFITVSAQNDDGTTVSNYIKIRKME